MGPGRCGDGSELLDQRRCNAFAPVRGRDGQIVDIDLAAFLLEFPEFIGGKTAHDRPVFQCGKSNEMIASEQPLQIPRAGTGF